MHVFIRQSDPILRSQFHRPIQGPPDALKIMLMLGRRLIEQPAMEHIRLGSQQLCRGQHFFKHAECIVHRPIVAIEELGLKLHAMRMHGMHANAKIIRYLPKLAGIRRLIFGKSIQEYFHMLNAIPANFP